jgi:hypothetical protein
VQSIGQ